MTKKVLLGLPVNLLSRTDFAAHAEGRTRSDLIREALRHYLDNFERQRLLMNESANISILERSYEQSSSC
jgi:metal-responsive CopG/Arc/MetJ family transcriptional regulator